MIATETKYYIETGILPPIVKKKQSNGNVCKCGNLLGYRTNPFMTTEKRVCPKCGAVHYVDYAPIDFDKAFNP